MRYILQCYSKDCGFTCLKILLANKFKSDAYLYLKNKNASHAYSYLELIDIAKDYGLTLVGFETNDKENLYKFDNFPFIASITYSEDKTLHAVIIKKATKRHVYYFDPTYGDIKVKFKKFLELWNGTGLYEESYDEVRTNIPSKFNLKLFRKRDIAILTLLELCSTVSIVFGTLFMDKTVPFYVPIILFSSFIIFEILFRSYSVSLMKKMDVYLYDKTDVLNTKFKNYFLAVEELKKQAVLLPINSVFKFLSCLLLLFITMMNNLYNIIPVFISIVLAISDVFIFKSKYNALNMSINAKEADMFIAKSLDKRNNFLKEIHQESYRFAYIHKSFEYLSWFILVISIIISMTLQNIYSLEYVVFNSFLFGYLLHTFKALFSINIDLENYKVAKAKINDLL